MAKKLSDEMRNYLEGDRKTHKKGRGGIFGRKKASEMPDRDARGRFLPAPDKFDNDEPKRGTKMRKSGRVTAYPNENEYVPEDQVTSEEGQSMYNMDPEAYLIAKEEGRFDEKVNNEITPSSRYYIAQKEYANRVALEDLQDRDREEEEERRLKEEADIATGNVTPEPEDKISQKGGGSITEGKGHQKSEYANPDSSRQPRDKSKKGAQWAKHKKDVNRYPQSEKRIVGDLDSESEAVLAYENEPHSSEEPDESSFESKMVTQEVVRELFENGFDNLDIEDLFPKLFEKNDKKSVRMQRAYRNKLDYIKMLSKSKVNDTSDYDQIIGHNKIETVEDLVTNIYKRYHEMYAENHAGVEKLINKQGSDVEDSEDDVMVGQSYKYVSPEDEIVRNIRLWVVTIDNEKYGGPVNENIKSRTGHMDMFRDTFRKYIFNERVGMKFNEPHARSGDVDWDLAAKSNEAMNITSVLMNLFPYEYTEDIPRQEAA